MRVRGSDPPRVEEWQFVPGSAVQTFDVDDDVVFCTFDGVGPNPDHFELFVDINGGGFGPVETVAGSGRQVEFSAVSHHGEVSTCRIEAQRGDNSVIDTITSDPFLIPE